ncbi:MAG: amine oxidase [Ginsengibacter sp.]
MKTNPFHSFWMAGYECTDKLNAFGDRVDLLSLTGHLKLLNEDYCGLKQFNIKTVREGIRWSQVETRPYEYDFSTVSYMMDCAESNGIQQLWDICHFGFPDDLTPLHPYFPRRFAALCKAFVQFYRSKNKTNELIVTPINEVSFLSWLGGDVRGTSPFCVGQGWEVKYRLMKAYIEGIAAMKEVDPDVRILTTEPLISRVAVPHANDEQVAEAKRIHDYQFQIFDILTGRICPELGGRPEYLDMLGCNFYYDNQTEVGTWRILDWQEKDNPGWRTLSNLFLELYQRYERPIVLSETSHPGIDRPLWIKMIGDECVATLLNEIPLWGVCLYPIIDRPDWDNLHIWHKSGLWDEEELPGHTPKRILYEPSVNALLKTQALLQKYQPEKFPSPMEIIV